MRRTRSWRNLTYRLSIWLEGMWNTMRNVKALWLWPDFNPGRIVYEAGVHATPTFGWNDKVACSLHDSDTNFLTLYPTKCQVWDEAADLKTEGCDNALPGQSCRASQEAVMHENIAMVEWWLAGENRRNSERNLHHCHFAHYKYHIFTVTRDWTQGSAVGSQFLTAWAMTLHAHIAHL
jgi:hypothetical protein